jgi:hypothetical protein
MPRNKIGMSIAALITAGAIGVGGAALANASATTSAATTGVTALSSDNSTTGSPQTNPQQGQAPTGRTGKAAGGASGAGAVAPHQHTDVTGDELAKVTAAVQAKDSAATVQSVQKDPDGSYDVHATKAGQPVMYEVSADLNTISEGPQGGPGGPGGGRAQHQHTDVTGDELAKVTAAVQAKDSAATVQSVQKDPDGSYDVHATKAGQPVMYEVSADLNTISEGPQGGPGAGGPGGPVGPPAPAPTGSAPTGSAQS